MLLSVAQEIEIVALDELVNSHSLIFCVVVATSIREEGALHALLDARLGALAVCVELSAVLFLHVEQVSLMVRFLVNPSELLLVLLLSEFLLSLQLLNAPSHFIFFPLQLYYPVFYLSLLVVLLLRKYNGIHHIVHWSLSRNRTHARVQ